MKALIFDSKVIQIEAQEFPVAPALSWVDITGIVPNPKVGWNYNGIIFTAPPPPPPRPPKSDAPLTADELATHLIGKGAVTRDEIDAIKGAR